VLAAPLHLLALVLVVSGIQKLVAPRAAAAAMADARLPVPWRGHAATGVALGAVEAATGIVALAVPHRLAAAWLGVFYLALAGFVLLLRARDADAGCGCFGASSTPPGTAHLVLNGAAAATAFGIAVAGVPDIVDVVDGGIVVAVAYVLLLGIGAAVLLVAPALTAETSRLLRGEHPTVRTFGSAP
jgi:Methylamine utilisation protein MauE